MPHLPLLIFGISAVVKAVTSTVVWKEYRLRKKHKQEIPHECDLEG